MRGRSSMLEKSRYMIFLKASCCLASSLRPTKFFFRSEKLTLNLARGQAKMGICLSSGSCPSSCPYSGNPASSRNVSRAPRPVGEAPLATSLSQSCGAASFSMNSSKPRGSPVYPVRAIFTALPFILAVLTALRAGSGKRSDSISSFKIVREAGPCKAIMAISSLRSVSSTPLKSLNCA